MMQGFYSDDELAQLGLGHVGENVLISKHANLYKPDQIFIGNSVRIDDFCVLAGKIVIGSFVHIAAGCVLYGGSEGIFMEDYSGLSSRCSIYAVTDSYLGNALTNPTVPMEFRDVSHKKVILGKHTIIGTNTVILPGVTLGEGSAVGASSMVSRSLPAWTISGGIPARPIKDREKTLLTLEQEHKSKYSIES